MAELEDVSGWDVPGAGIATTIIPPDSRPLTARLVVDPQQARVDDDVGDDELREIINKSQNSVQGSKRPSGATAASPERQRRGDNDSRCDDKPSRNSRASPSRSGSSPHARASAATGGKSPHGVSRSGTQLSDSYKHLAQTSESVGAEMRVPGLGLGVRLSLIEEPVISPIYRSSNVVTSVGYAGGDDAQQLAAAGSARRCSDSSSSSMLIMGVSPTRPLFPMQPSAAAATCAVRGMTPHTRQPTTHDGGGKGCDTATGVGSACLGQTHVTIGSLLGCPVPRTRQQETSLDARSAVPQPPSRPYAYNAFNKPGSAHTRRARALAAWNGMAATPAPSLAVAGAQLTPPASRAPSAASHVLRSRRSPPAINMSDVTPGIGPQASTLTSLCAHSAGERDEFGGREAYVDIHTVSNSSHAAKAHRGVRTSIMSSGSFEARVWEQESLERAAAHSRRVEDANMAAVQGHASDEQRHSPRRHNNGSHQQHHHHHHHEHSHVETTPSAYGSTLVSSIFTSHALMCQVRGHSSGVWIPEVGEYLNTVRLADGKLLHSCMHHLSTVIDTEDIDLSGNELGLGWLLSDTVYAAVGDVIASTRSMEGATGNGNFRSSAWYPGGDMSSSCRGDAAYTSGVSMRVPLTPMAEWSGANTPGAAVLALGMLPVLTSLNLSCNCISAIPVPPLWMCPPAPSREHPRTVLTATPTAETSWEDTEGHTSGEVDSDEIGALRTSNAGSEYSRQQQVYPQQQQQGDRHHLGNVIPGRMFPSLQSLNLSFNTISLASLGMLVDCVAPTLRSLTLEANKLTTLPTNIAKLLACEHLDLTNNLLSGDAIMIALAGLPHLRRLLLDANCFIDIPEDCLGLLPPPLATPEGSAVVTATAATAARTVPDTDILAHIIPYTPTASVLAPDSRSAGFPSLRFISLCHNQLHPQLALDKFTRMPLLQEARLWNNPATNSLRCLYPQSVDTIEPLPAVDASGHQCRTLLLVFTEPLGERQRVYPFDASKVSGYSPRAAATHHHAQQTGDGGGGERGVTQHPDGHDRDMSDLMHTAPSLLHSHHVAGSAVAGSALTTAGSGTAGLENTGVGNMRYSRGRRVSHPQDTYADSPQMHPRPPITAAAGTRIQTAQASIQASPLRNVKSVPHGSPPVTHTEQEDTTVDTATMLALRGVHAQAWPSERTLDTVDSGASLIDSVVARVNSDKHGARGQYNHGDALADALSHMLSQLPSSSRSSEPAECVPSVVESDFRLVMHTLKDVVADKSILRSLQLSPRGHRASTATATDATAGTTSVVGGGGSARTATSTMGTHAPSDALTTATVRSKVIVPAGDSCDPFGGYLPEAVRSPPASVFVYPTVYPHSSLTIHVDHGEMTRSMHTQPNSHSTGSGTQVNVIVNPQEECTDDDGDGSFVNPLVRFIGGHHRMDAQVPVDASIIREDASHKHQTGVKDMVSAPSGRLAAGQMLELPLLSRPLSYMPRLLPPPPHHSATPARPSNATGIHKDTPLTPVYRKGRRAAISGTGSASGPGVVGVYPGSVSQRFRGGSPLAASGRKTISTS